MRKNYFWYVVNVVWYDGVDAYATKFVLQGDENYKISSKSKELTIEYLDGNGEILKFDVCYAISLENIIAYKDSEKKEIYQRFNEMWF